MAGKGRGYHGHSREHGLHRKGIPTRSRGKINAINQLKKQSSNDFKVVSRKWRKNKWNSITFTKGKNKLYSVMKIDNDLINISYIEADQKDIGLGTIFMKNIKEYADSTGRSIVISHQTNPDFFNKFSWLERMDKKTLLYKGKITNSGKQTNFIKQLEVGTIAEMGEHDVNKKGGTKIALDHLIKEDPEYYFKLFKCFPDEHPELRKQLAKGIPKTKMYDGRKFKYHSSYVFREWADVMKAKLKRRGFKVKETITSNGIIVLYKYGG